MGFDALMTEEEKTKAAAAEQRRHYREAVMMDVSAESAWAKEVEKGASMILAQIGSATSSESLMKLATAMRVVASGKCPIPPNCEHVSSEASYRPDIMHLCLECFQKWFDVMNLPIPMVIENLKYDEKNPKDYKYAISRHTYMMVPARLGYAATLDAAFALLDEMPTESAQRALVEAAEKKLNGTTDDSANS